MQVRNALTRQRKEEIVADLKEKLEDSVIVFGMRFKGLDVSCPRRCRDVSLQRYRFWANGPVHVALGCAANSGRRRSDVCAEGVGFHWGPAQPGPAAGVPETSSILCCDWQQYVLNRAK
jgi:hypothetical protein